MLSKNVDSLVLLRIIILNGMIFNQYLAYTSKDIHSSTLIFLLAIDIVNSNLMSMNQN